MNPNREHDTNQKMIALSSPRALTLAEALAPGRPCHLSAASGLVSAGSFTYVIADDELHLGVFQGHEPGQVIRLFEGELPSNAAERKKKKPDLEALALLPPHQRYPFGALLALGSGSTIHRRCGVLLALNSQGKVAEQPRIIDFSSLFRTLEDTFSALNIEGAVVVGDELRLFQRGNARNPDNAIISYRLEEFLSALHSAPVPSLAPVGIIRVDLGKVDGVALCFTDATALPDGRVIFTAVAEDSDNNYDDGPCRGAAIGIIDGQGRLQQLYHLDRPYKVEGIEARVDGKAIRLQLVTDADNPSIAAFLYAAEIGP